MPTGPGFPYSPVQPPRRAHPQAAQARAPLGCGGFCLSVGPASAAATAARPGCSGASSTSSSGRWPAPSRPGPSGRPASPARRVPAPSVWTGAVATDPVSRSTPVGLLVRQPGLMPPRRRERGVLPRAGSPVSPRGRVRRRHWARGPPAGGALARAAPLETAWRAGPPGSSGLVLGGVRGPPAHRTPIRAGRVFCPGRAGTAPGWAGGGLPERRAKRGPVSAPSRRAGAARLRPSPPAGRPAPLSPLAPARAAPPGTVAAAFRTVARVGRASRPRARACARRGRGPGGLGDDLLPGHCPVPHTPAQAARAGALAAAPTHRHPTRTAREQTRRKEGFRRIPTQSTTMRTRGLPLSDPLTRPHSREHRQDKRPSSQTHDASGKKCGQTVGGGHLGLGPGLPAW